MGILGRYPQAIEPLNRHLVRKNRREKEETEDAYHNVEGLGRQIRPR